MTIPISCRSTVTNGHAVTTSRQLDVRRCEVRRRQVQVAVGDDAIELAIAEELIRSHLVREDRTRQHTIPRNLVVAPTVQPCLRSYRSPEQIFGGYRTGNIGYVPVLDIDSVLLRTCADRLAPLTRPLRQAPYFRFDSTVVNDRVCLACLLCDAPKSLDFVRITRIECLCALL